jgi:hypothetical protein
VCAYSLDHITPSRLGVIDVPGGTKPGRELNDFKCRALEGPRLSLYDTSGLRISNVSLSFRCQRTRTRPQRPIRFNHLTVCAQSFRVVGLGGLEPPASPLSGVRSNHLSYRPNVSSCLQDGGACRDRTDDPLLAKQVLSQLS